MLKRRTAKIIAATTVALAVVAGCKFNDMNKKKVDDQNNNLSADARSGTCGTVGSIGETDGTGKASVVVQQVICGQLPDSPNPWKALGLTVKTPTVYMHRGGTALDASKEMAAEIELDGGKVYASGKGERTLIGTVENGKEGDTINYSKNITVQIGIDGRPVDFKQAKEKAPGDYDVFITPGGE